MNVLATVGQRDASIRYTDRPTVKVVITNGDQIVLVNNGLLPGGGIDPGESDHDAIARELQEELGVTVKEIKPIGMVIQHRNLLSKKYLIKGYMAILDTTGGTTTPQDEGEASFELQWFTLNDAFTQVRKSIDETLLKPLWEDANQGRVFNLVTTYAFLKAIAKR